MFHHEWMGGMWFGWIFWIILIALLVWIILKRNNRSDSGPTQNTESALDVLKRRYASGEITKEEFESMKKDIL